MSPRELLCSIDMITTHKVLLGVGIAVALISSLVGVAFYATRGLPATAQNFFLLIQDGRTSEAYQSTSARFQASYTQEDFDRMIANDHLEEYQGASWSSRSIENDEGRLEGTIRLVSHDPLPYRLHLVKEEETWKVDSLEKASSDTNDAAGKEDLVTPVPPTEAEAETLAHDSLLSFYQAVLRNDFTAFYLGLSPIWQEQTDAEDLKAQFAEFVATRIDLSGVISNPVELSEPPRTDEDNLLILQGTVPNVPDAAHRLAFELTYHQHEGAWKLFAIGVDVVE